MPTFIFNPFTGNLDAVGTGGGGGGANCATAPTLLCLAGRSGTSNDAIISSDDVGSIYGSGHIGDPTSHPFGLHINARTTAELGPFSVNSINANTRTVRGPSVLWEFGNFQGPITFNDDASFGNSGLIGFGIGGEWVVGDDSLGGPSGQTFSYNPTVHNPSGVAKHIFSNLDIFAANPTFLSLAAACDMPGNYTHFFSHPSFHTSGGGTLVVNGYFNYTAALASQTGVTINQVVGYQYDGITGAGSVTSDRGIEIRDGDVHAPAGAHISLISTGPLRQMQHGGPAVFGIATNPTTVSVGLELQSTTLVIVPSRMSGAQETALTAPLDGQFLYLNDSNVYRGRTAGTNVSFITDDGAGNVAVAAALDVATNAHIHGKLTVDGAIDPTDITYSGQLISTHATGVAPLAVTSTTVNTNLNADLLDGLQASAFFQGNAAQLLAPIRLSTQIADIADTAITGTAGLYRVHVYVVDTAADITAGAIQVHIKFNDSAAARDQTVGPVVLTSVTTGVASATIFVRLVSGNLTYGVTHTGAFGAATYALDVTTERLT